jgi:hypothetical protein
MQTLERILANSTQMALATKTFVSRFSALPFGIPGDFSTTNAMPIRYFCYLWLFSGGGPSFPDSRRLAARVTTQPRRHVWFTIYHRFSRKPHFWTALDFSGLNIAFWLESNATCGAVFFQLHFVRRAGGAHNNSLEAFPPFVAGILMCHLRRTSRSGFR